MLLRSYQGEEPYIFISYAHRDSERVFPILERMSKAGYRFWYDEGIDPGTEWDENIAAHISNADYFIAFVSQHYLESKNCKDELTFARELDKNQLMIYLEDTVLPDGLRMRLNRIQAIHWYRYQDTEQAVEKLRKTSGIDPCVDDGGTPAAVRNKKRPPSMEQEQQSQTQGVGKTRKKRWIPILAAVLLLAAAVILVLKLTGGSGEQPEESTQTQQTTQLQTEEPAQTTEPEAVQPQEPAFRHVTIYAPEECPISAYEICRETLRQRLELLTQYDGSYQLSESSFTLEAEIPSKAFGERPVIEILRAFVVRRGQFYFGTESSAPEEFLPLTPEDVAEVSQVSQQGMMASGTNMSDTSPLQYVKLVLTQEYAEANAEALSGFGKDLILAQDVELDPYAFHTAELSEDGRTLYIAMAERGPQFPELMIHMLQSKPLSYGFTFIVRPDPTWETVPDGEVPGEYQVDVKELEGPTVTLLYVPPVKELSPGDWLDTRIQIKKRLDTAGIPYNFGTTDTDYQIAVRLGLDRIGPIWIDTICANSGKLRLYVGLDALDVSFGKDVFQIKTDGDAPYVELHLEEDIAQALKDLVSVSGNQIRLGFEGNLIWLETDAAELEGNVLTFRRMAAGASARALRAEDLPALALIEQVFSGEQLPVRYRCDQKVFAAGSDGKMPTESDYGIPLSDTVEEAISRIREAVPEADVYLRESNSNRNIVVQMDLERNEHLPARAADAALKAYSASDLENVAVDSLMLVFVQENDQIKERCRFLFSKHIVTYSTYFVDQWPDHYSPGRIEISAAFHGPDMEAYINPFREIVEGNQAFRNLLYGEAFEFYTD